MASDGGSVSRASSPVRTTRYSGSSSHRASVRLTSARPKATQAIHMPTNTTRSWEEVCFWRERTRTNWQSSAVLKTVLAQAFQFLLSTLFGMPCARAVRLYGCAAALGSERTRVCRVPANKW
eukprot:scaffold13749_cov60-Phaeocystis_antarctica.AAC.2